MAAIRQCDRSDVHLFHGWQTPAARSPFGQHYFVCEGIGKEKKVPEAKEGSDEPIRSSILNEANGIINGERLDSYGPPAQSFGRIAALWSAMGLRFEAHDGATREINATDVALALVQLKMARLVNSPDHRDSWVDVAGYSGLGGEIGLTKPDVRPMSEVIEEVIRDQHSGDSVAVKPEWPIRVLTTNGPIPGEHIVFRKMPPLGAGRVRCMACLYEMRWEACKDHLIAEHPNVPYYSLPDAPPWDPADYGE